MKWKALAVVVKIVVKRIYNQLHPPDIYNNKKERIVILFRYSSEF